ncbi:MAG: phosphoglucosamine mutase [Flavobacteriales bacterium]
MALIKSISGIRGEIGGQVGSSLTPVDIVKFTSAYAQWLLAQHPNQKTKVIIGRDARMSGAVVSQMVSSTLQMMGIDVVDLGLSTTPTVEMAVVWNQAQGGIILTASHNPKQWNALKLLNQKGEFISGADGEKLLQLAENEAFDFALVDDLGNYSTENSAIDRHVNLILDLPLVKANLDKKRSLKFVVDAINSTGATAVPAMLKALGYHDVVVLHGAMHGDFEHNPEPLKAHLKAISEAMISEKADIGIVVDPDVDRLAFVCEDGTMFGEEYTLVAVADYVLRHQAGTTVSNMSSTKALRDVTEKLTDFQSFSSAVGEVNVVEMMKEKQATIGGEGNGGIIYPELHYGRDALVGIALFLNHFVDFEGSLSQFRDQYPYYFIAKKKIELSADFDIDAALAQLKAQYETTQEINTIDGLKLYFEDSWVHIRKSNTEPIVRIYAEATSEDLANQLADRFIAELQKLN